MMKKIEIAEKLIEVGEVKFVDNELTAKSLAKNAKKEHLLSGVFRVQAMKEDGGDYHGLACSIINAIEASKNNFNENTLQTLKSII